MAKREPRPRIAESETGQGDTRTRIAFRLSSECVRRLKVHCAMGTERPNNVVERLILDHVPRWVVQDRSPKAAQEESAA